MSLIGNEASDEGSKQQTSPHSKISHPLVSLESTLALSPVDEPDGVLLMRRIELKIDGFWLGRIHSSTVSKVEGKESNKFGLSYLQLSDQPRLVLYVCDATACRQKNQRVPGFPARPVE